MSGIGIWRLGFRPFYLGAALFGGLAILLWLAALFGIYSIPGTALTGQLQWHSHEMVFGFAFAVIAGFLLTASNNWTGILPAAGLPLAALFLLWAGARFFMVFGNVIFAAIFDLLFASFLVLLLLRVLWLAKLWKNFPILGIVLLIAALNAWFYSLTLGGAYTNPLYPIELALLAILQLLVIMGGRVIPMFTQNGVPRISVWKPSFLSTLTPVSTAFGIVAWLWSSPSVSAVFCLVACLVNLIRWLGWKPWRTLRYPMVWVLQLGYFWIPATFLFMGFESLGIVARTLPIHALAVGGLGSIVAGMITRTAMGHTGRMIAPTRIDITFFILMLLAGLIRVLAAMPSVQSTSYAFTLLLVSGSCWTAGFFVYLYQYTPWLFRPRIDGRPG